MTRNERTVNVKISRIELCDILIALTAISEGGYSKKWDKLHDKLEKILDDWDHNHPVE